MNGPAQTFGTTWVLRGATDWCGSREPPAYKKRVDLGQSYKAQVRKYSKNCFDPFGRGSDVLHRTKDGRYMTFSIRRLMFFG